MVSTLNAWPSPSTLSFSHSQCHSEIILPGLKVHYIFVFTHLQWIKWMKSPIIILGKPAEFELFNILSVPFVCFLALSIFVLANLLLVRRLTSVRQKKDWRCRTILSTVLNMCAPSQQEGKSEGCCLAKFGRPQGTGCLEAPHTHSGACCTLHANEAKRFLSASGQNCEKVTMSPAGGWYACTKTYKGLEGGRKDRQKNSGISNNDQHGVLIKGLRQWLKLNNSMIDSPHIFGRWKRGS